MILTDFHIHSNFSDGKHSIPDIVDFYGRRGFGAIAITDHLCERTTFLGKAAGVLERTLTPANFDLYLNILKSEQERAFELYGMLLIPGFEVTKNSISNHRSAHIVALGIQEWVPADPDVAEIAIRIREQGALSVAAHPLSTQKLEKQTIHLWNRREELRPLFDAWEVGSGKHYFQEVEDEGLPILATTDLHHFGQMTAWKTLLEVDLAAGDTLASKIQIVLDAVRQQKVKPTFYREENHGVPFPGPWKLFAPAQSDELESPLGVSA